MRLDLPVMLLLLLAAAAAQTLAPPLAPGYLKAPVLPGVVVYYALCRPPFHALNAALWAGILTDALGGVPQGTSAFFLLFAALLLLALRRVLPEDSAGAAAVLGGILAPALGCTQYLMLRSQWESRPGLGVLTTGLLLLVPAGALVAGLLFRLARTLDVWSGNVKRKEDLARHEK